MREDKNFKDKNKTSMVIQVHINTLEDKLVNFSFPYSFFHMYIWMDSYQCWRAGSFLESR